MNQPDKSTLSQRLAGMMMLVALGFLIYVTDSAQWAVQVAMCTLFCSIIYLRDHDAPGRWVAMGIILVGTSIALALQLYVALQSQGLIKI